MLINTLCTDINDLKLNDSMGPSDMSMLLEAMRDPKNTLGPIDTLRRSMGISEEEVDEEKMDVQRAIEESLRSAHS